MAVLPKKKSQQNSVASNRVSRKTGLSLSVVMATHNESAHLQRTLQAVLPIMDELIIVDGSSDDETVAIAKTFGAKVLSQPNRLNFHINKKYGLDRASGDLIFQLDADEVLDAELLDWIALLKQGARAGESGWWLKRRNFFLGKFLTKGGQYPDPVIRIYRKGKGHLPAKHVHEQIEIDGSVGWADGHLLHYSNPTFADYLRKMNHYTSFTASLWAEAKQPISWQNTWKWLFWQPCVTFLTLYIRHRGYVDGVAGFVFALMSGLHYPIAYLKLWEGGQRKLLGYDEHD